MGERLREPPNASLDGVFAKGNWASLLRLEGPPTPRGVALWELDWARFVCAIPGQKTAGLGLGRIMVAKSPWRTEVSG
jgi:hypothetical protein